MIKNLSMVFLLVSAALFGQNTVTYTYNGPPLLIFTDDANTVSVASITVGRVFSIQKVTINVNVDYTPVGDINLYAYAPDGTRTKLVERNCGSQGTLINMTFDDAAPSRYSDSCPTEAGRGTYRGNEPLSNFLGKSSAGIWRLAVENNGSQRNGWLTGWSITFTTGDNVVAPVIANVVNRSSLKGGAIAPGSNLLVYGANIGPSTITNAPVGQTLPTTLAGVQVLVNGTAIPLKAVSSVGIDAVAPTGLSTGTTASLQVITSSGTGSNIVNPSVQATAPGLYSQGRIGGPTGGWLIVKAVDQNFKTITLDNPATKGGIVTVYASGLGATNPVLAAGQVPPSSPLYPTTGTTSASIGGLNAPVLFSGLAPGYPGVYQLNIRVPDNIASGNHQILIWNGGGVSQDDLTIPIR